MAKPIKTLELHYQMIQFLIISNVPCSRYITARDQSMVESGMTEGGKNTASFVKYFVNRSFSGFEN